MHYSDLWELDPLTMLWKELPGLGNGVIAHPTDVILPGQNTAVRCQAVDFWCGAGRTLVASMDTKLYVYRGAQSSLHLLCASPSRFPMTLRGGLTKQGLEDWRRWMGVEWKITSPRW